MTTLDEVITYSVHVNGGVFMLRHNERDLTSSYPTKLHPSLSQPADSLSLSAVPVAQPAISVAQPAVSVAQSSVSLSLQWSTQCPRCRT